MERNGTAGRTKVGLQFEFDMGLVTGRTTGTISSDPTEKKRMFNMYLQEMYWYVDAGIPIGIYSGGPNEQGYSNIHDNRNIHNFGNHLPYPTESSNPFFYEGLSYDKYPGAYKGGNLIYDINRFLFNGRWSSRLTNFGLQQPTYN